MTIKAVILDVSGTLLKQRIYTGPSIIVQDIPEMIFQLRKRGISVFAATNEGYDYSLIKSCRLNIDDDKILYPELVGGKKGSKKFVQYIYSRFGINPNELLYLGDSQNDCYEAVNSHVAFFLAAWSNPNYQYGIVTENPQKFVEFIDTFFLKNVPWYYTIDDVDSLSRSVTVRALLDPDKSKTSGITDLLKSKGLRGPSIIKTYPSSWYLSMQLFSSIYLEGLHLSPEGRKLTWCVYPGHTGHYDSILNDFVEMISRAFNERFVPRLIQRHVSAAHSSYFRARGSVTTINNQLLTIHLDPAQKEKIVGKPVIVVDDFTTYAYSFETARNFLLNAKAKSVTCIAVGKYPAPYMARSPKDGVIWDSFVPSTVKEEDFLPVQVQASTDMGALASF